MILASAILAAAPQPSWAGIITAVASLFTAVALVITALAGFAAVRRTAAKVENNQEETRSRLSVIHTLVNSTLTAALQAQLDATRRELTMMLELAGAQPPSDDRQAAIGALRRKVEELTAAMRDRADQTRVADIQIAAEADRTANF
jgi:heme/copper-type cytochrome/quinol oxidase subunit 2